MRLAFLFTAVLAANAAEYAPAGILRGNISTVPTTASSDLHVRTAAGETLRCGMDSLTWVERYGQRVKATGLKAGDPVEVVAERRAAGPCYALTVRVSTPKPVVPADTGYRSRLKPPRPVVESWMPRGNLTFAGVVLRLNPELLILRLRDGELVNVVLREDTRYASAGIPAAHDQLLPNTRVFVRGGRNLDQEIEAYQVVWGRIEGP